jgi:hypothetical protein
VTSTARLWYLLAGDVEAEHHVMWLCMCFAALLCNALENLVLLRQMQPIRRASVIAAINGVVGGVGLALLVAKVVSLATGAAWQWGSPPLRGGRRAPSPVILTSMRDNHRPMLDCLT